MRKRLRAPALKVKRQITKKHMKTKLTVLVAATALSAGASETCLRLAIGLQANTVCLIVQQCEQYPYCVRTYVGTFTNQHCMMLTTDQARAYSNCIIAGPFTGPNGMPTCNIACSQMTTNPAPGGTATIPLDFESVRLPSRVNLLTSTNLATWSVVGSFDIDEAAFEYISFQPELNSGTTEIYGQRLAEFPIANNQRFYRTQDQ